jgi:hypothetical protein
LGGKLRESEVNWRAFEQSKFERLLRIGLKFKLISSFSKMKNMQGNETSNKANNIYEHRKLSKNPKNHYKLH